MKSLIDLLQLVLIDMGTRCGTSTTRDFKTVTSRLEHEGWSFLTITLSAFGRDFQQALDQGYVADSMFAGFRRHEGLPSFLGGFLRQVFEPNSGRLVDVPNVEAVLAIRQITLMFGKILLPCTRAREEAAFDKYVETEKEVREYDGRLLGSDLLDRFARVSRRLWSAYLTDVDSFIHDSGVLPKHGPGATADRLRGNRKRDRMHWTLRLEQEFPARENLVPNDGLAWSEVLDEVDFLPPGAELPVRVITVPKTLKTPRIIAIEPTCMQYMQQGILEVMREKALTNDNVRNFLLWDSQVPNQELAREGSEKGHLATLDLSEASDRVSNLHVRTVLQNHGNLRRAVDATRSRKADVPGRGIHSLAKFASMGSALCFPFESLVFVTAVFVGIEESLGHPLAVDDFQSYYGKVRVYGDDIIVPVEFVQSVVKVLEDLGFRVGADKSFWTGKFRESCGADWYDGHSVNVIRVRRPLPKSRRDAEEVISAVSLRNQLFWAGSIRAVDFLDKLMTGIIPFPVVEEGSPLLGRHSYGPCQPERYDRRLHRPLVKGVVAVSQLPSSKLDGYGALMKFFLKRGDKPLAREHLMRAGRPVSVRIKDRWSTPYSYGVDAEQ